MKKTLIVLSAMIMVFSFASCKKESEAPLTQGGPSMAPQGQQPQGMPPGGISVPTERVIVVPEGVKGMWSGVVITVQDKATGKSSDHAVKLGGEYAIPGSDVKIKVEEFIPDFIMNGGEITSRSPEPNNPAAKITVLEGGQDIFNSWIYSNHPAIHPFQHEKYGITLKEGTKAGK